MPALAIVVMIAVARITVILRERALAHLQRLVEAEGQNGFGGNFDGVSFGDGLSSGAGCSANRRADSRPFSAARDGSDDAPNCRAASDVFGGSLILTNALSGGFVHTVTGNDIPSSIHRDGLQVDTHIPAG